MAVANDQPTARRKRTIEEIEFKREGLAQVEGDANRHQIKVENDRSQQAMLGGQETRQLQDVALPSSPSPYDYIGCLSEDTPQAQISQELDDLLADLEMRDDPTTQIKFDVHNEHALQQDSQLISDWTRDRDVTEQDAGAAEKFSFQGLERQNNGDKNQELAFETAKLPTASHTSEVAPSSRSEACGTESPFEHHTDQCREELEKQDLVLELLLSGPSWNQLSVIEKQQRKKEAWVARARDFEREFISQFVVDLSEIDFRSTRKGDILVRQGELIKRAFYQNNPLPLGANAQECADHQDQMVAVVKRKRLSTVRSWTAEWEEELSDKGLSVSAENIAIDALSSEETLLTSSLDSSTGGPSYPAQATNKPPYHQYRPFASAAAPLNLPHPNSEPQPLVYPSSFFLPPPNAILPSQPFPNSCNPPAPEKIHYGHAGPMAMPMAGPSNPSAAMSPQKKKRGAPRTRMFITKPQTDVPLSVTAQTDNEEVLKSYPEHLSIIEVMKRFVRQPGSRSGGWPTELMVDFLEPHPNARDFQGITRAQRRANLKRWVVKERDMCTSHQRKVAGNSLKRVSDPPQIILQDPPPVTASQPSQQQVNTPIQALPDAELAAQNSGALETGNDRHENAVDSAWGPTDFNTYQQLMDTSFVDFAPSSRQAGRPEGMAQSFSLTGPINDQPNEPNVTGQIDEEGWKAFFNFEDC